MDWLLCSSKACCGDKQEPAASGQRGQSCQTCQNVCHKNSAKPQACAPSPSSHWEPSEAPSTDERCEVLVGDIDGHSSTVTSATATSTVTSALDGMPLRLAACRRAKQRHDTELSEIVQLDLRQGRLRRRQDRGHWNTNEPLGIGMLESPDGPICNGALLRYTGQWRDQVPQGIGVLESPDGSKYEGVFQNGRARGPGRFTAADGSVYEGLWELDEGRFTAETGEVYSRCDDRRTYEYWRDVESHDGAAAYARREKELHERQKSLTAARFQEKTLATVRRGMTLLSLVPDEGLFDEF